MIKINGAVVKEQGVTFAIVIVKPAVFNSEKSKQDMAVYCSNIFPSMPIILMKQDYRGTPTYWGRTDIVKFLANISISRIPWREYSVA